MIHGLTWTFALQPGNALQLGEGGTAGPPASRGLKRARELLLARSVPLRAPLDGVCGAMGPRGCRGVAAALEPATGGGAPALLGGGAPTLLGGGAPALLAGDGGAQDPCRCWPLGVDGGNVAQLREPEALVQGEGGGKRGQGKWSARLDVLVRMVPPPLLAPASKVAAPLLALCSALEALGAELVMAVREGLRKGLGCGRPTLNRMGPGDAALMVADIATSATGQLL